MAIILKTSNFTLTCKKCGSTDCIVDVSPAYTPSQAVLGEGEMLYNYYVHCNSCTNHELLYTG